MYRIEDFKRIPDVIDPDSPVAWPSCVEHTPTGQRYGCCSVGPIVLDADGRRSEEVECDSELWRMLRRCMNEPPEPEHESEPARSETEIIHEFCGELRSALREKLMRLGDSVDRFTNAGADASHQLSVIDGVYDAIDIIYAVEAKRNEA